MIPVLHSCSEQLDRSRNRSQSVMKSKSQCSRLSFECSGVLSHVCGHVTKVVKKKIRRINKLVLKLKECFSVVFNSCHC